MPYRAEARLRIGPSAIRQTNPEPFLERLKQTSAVGTAARIAAQQRAAERKIAREMAQKQQQEETMRQIQEGINRRTRESQQKIQQNKNQTITHYQRVNERIEEQNARLRRQQLQERRQQRLGASQYYENPNFRGGDGRLVAVGGEASKKAAAIINEALKYRGRMYQWGGSNPQTSFDCSGLVQWAYKSVGVGVPRVSADQARYGKKVPLQALRPGDLVAWDNSSRNNGADHIAIYIGNGQIIEAPRTGQQIRVRALGQEQNAWGVQILK